MTMNKRQYVGDSGANDQHVHSEVIGGNTADTPLTYDADMPLDYNNATSGNVFDDAGGPAEGDFSAEFTCDGKAMLVIKGEFKKSSGSAKLRPFFRDHGATAHWVAGDDITVEAQSAKHTTEIVATSDAAYYVSRRYVVPTYGAKSVKFRLIDTDGKATTFVAAV